MVLADIVITENDDGSVTYDVTMRDDIVFSDGETANIDDVILRPVCLPGSYL